MANKNYLIYPTITIECDDQSSKAKIEEARSKALETAKKEFKKAVKEIEYVSVRKDQLIADAVMISIDEDKLDKATEQLIALDIVATIDSYGDVVITEKAEKTAKEKMEKFLK